jgi:hypothetical protein
MLWSNADLRRQSPRVPIESLCSEVHGDDRPRHALILDVSDEGLRIQRPLGGPRTRILQLELELPGIDEVLWATGAICFDEVTQAGRALLRTSGVRLLSTAARHKRLLRDFVYETWQTERPRDDHEFLLDASCYLRG